MKELREAVIEALKNCTYSHYKIGKETGITPETISNYRSGATKPSLANAKILASYFGIEIDDHLHVKATPIGSQDQIAFLQELVRRQQDTIDKLTFELSNRTRYAANDENNKV